MNNTVKKIALITAAVAAVSLGIAAILFFATYRSGSWELKNGIGVEERETFPPEGINEITVQTSSAEVFVGTNEGSTIEVYLHGTVYSGRREAVPMLIAEQTGEMLKIATERTDGRTLFLGLYSEDLVLEISLPKQYRGALAVHTSSGDVDTVDQNLAGLSVDTSSGDIRLRSVQAVVVSLESSSGDQKVEGLQAGRAELSSSSGELRVGGLQGEAEAESSSGDIHIQYRRFDADLEVRSSSGEIKLFLTETASFHLEARSSSGDILCSFPLTLAGAGSKMERNTLIGAVGEGIHRVAVRSSSGDITIRP